MAKRKIPNGSKVQKVKGHDGDKHVVGAIGRVIEYCGTAAHPVTLKKLHGYKVEWESGIKNMIWDDGRLAVLKEVN